MEIEEKKARPAAARKIFSGRIFSGLFTDTTRLWAVELGYGFGERLQPNAGYEW